MIQPVEGRDSERWAHLAFSRLFSIDGCKRYDYVPRPGKEDIKTQLQVIRSRLEDLYNKRGGKKVPVVFLEDNVRKAGMINWAMDQMQMEGIFDYASPEAIATYFCCADEKERGKIRVSEDHAPVKVLPVIDYKAREADVITPRDLMFDGIVVKVNGENTRLPALFMNLPQRMGIKPDRATQEIFADEIVGANITFCESLESRLGVEIPVSWVIRSDAIEKRLKPYIPDVSGDMRMAEVMERIVKYLPLPDVGELSFKNVVAFPGLFVQNGKDMRETSSVNGRKFDIS